MENLLDLKLEGMEELSNKEVLLVNGGESGWYWLGRAARFVADAWGDADEINPDWYREC